MNTARARRFYRVDRDAGIDPQIAAVMAMSDSRGDEAASGDIPADLHIRLGIAIAQRTYRAYRELLASPRLHKLAAIGARPQPWEASGTSGMKVLVNGGINLSELDGWWAEAYTHEVGWALGDGQERGDDPSRDATEAGALYDLLEREVVPEFYSRDANGIPTAWVARMRESMARLTAHFSINRVVRNYTEQQYLPAASAFRERAADKGAIGVQMVEWQRALRQTWSALRFAEVKVDTEGGQHLFEVQVYLGGIDPQVGRVELYGDACENGAPVRQEMERVQQTKNDETGSVYRARVSAARPAMHYTPRIVAHHGCARVPLEAAFIMWQR